MAIQPDEKIVTGSNFWNSDTDKGVIATRLNSDGSLDNSFDADGVASVVAPENSVEDVRIQADGKVVLFGGNLVFQEVRLNANGSLDTSFGNSTVASAVADKVSLAASHDRHSRSLRIGQVTPMASQAIESAVAGTGLVTTSLSSGDDFASAGVIAPNGDLLSAGTVNKLAFGFTRHSSAGNLVTSVTTAFGGDWEGAQSIILQPDGKIVLGGFTRSRAPFDKWTGAFAMARYNADGSLDNTFGTKGKVTTSFGKDVAGIGSLVLQPDGKIVALSGLDTTSPVLVMARYNPNGSLDKSFGTSGKLVCPTGMGGTGLAMQGTKFLVVGYVATGGTTGEDFMIRRLLANGSVDTSFGTNGMVATNIGAARDRALDLAIQPDGKLVASGLSGDSNNSDFVVARYSADGVLDPTFGGGVGFVKTNVGGNEQAFGLAIQSDGAIVIGGTTSAAGGPAVVVRYLSDGTLDSSFGIGGAVTSDFGIPIGVNDLRLQPDGNIVLFGYAYVATSPDSALNNYDFAMIRYLPNGTLDTTF